MVNGQWSSVIGFRASLYLCALFRGGLYPLLNSDTKIRARVMPSVFDDFSALSKIFSPLEGYFLLVGKVEKVVSYVFLHKNKENIVN